MTSRERFDIWAPPGAAWSPWVKPVLFAHRVRSSASPTIEPAEIPGWAAAGDGRTAVVLDVPCAAGVRLGMWLAASAGFRPVPLYNAVPGPGGDVSMVDVWPIVDALAAAAPALRDLRLPGGAPPAFLLDADRRRGRGAPLPGRFDNRSVSFPTDFPGASFLMSRGIREALLVHDLGAEPRSDLAHTLRRWEEAGITVWAKSSLDAAPPVRCNVRRPAWYRSAIYRLIELSGLRRSALGGFGGALPEPGSGS